MADLKEKIARLFPDASFDDANILVVNIPDAQWHKLAQTLRDELGFDRLVTIVGMDWAESLGCYYYLTSTKSGEHISIRVATTDRLKPMLHSVADLWAIAGIYEREVYDFFGIVFINNPDMRRLFLSIDWKGFPSAKTTTPTRLSIPSRPKTSARPTSPTLGWKMPQERWSKGGACVCPRRLCCQHRPAAPCHSRRAPFPYSCRR